MRETNLFKTNLKIEVVISTVTEVLYVVSSCNQVVGGEGGGALLLLLSGNLAAS